MDLISLLIIIVIFGVLFWVFQALIPIPQPFKNAALAVIVIFFLLYMLDGFHVGHLRYLK